MAEASQGASAAARAAVAIAVTVAATAAVMVLLGDQGYLWIKAVHVIAIISWMAGMLYLPRLFIYHCDAAPGSDKSETFKIMEQRLFRIIINPAMVISWVLGLWLAYTGGFLMAGWFHAKLLMALALSGVQGYFSASVRRFAEDRNTVSARHWRMWNEAPTLLMVVIVILVIVKPF